MELGLSGKTALIVASSQGLGKAIATQLVTEGANVMLLSRNEEKLASLQQELTALNKGTIAYTVCDVTNKENIKQAVEQTVQTFGTINILVNNAGGPKPGTFEQLTDDDWYSSFELNLLSYVRMIREVLPHMKQQGGKIINIASSSIKEPIPGLLLSNTFRVGITGLSKTLASELAPYNILINTIAPGRIATDRIASLDEIAAEKRGITVEDVQKQFEAIIPLGRYGHPSEFATFAAFLVSDANTYMTGQSFLVDGGMVKSL
ncbi:SDR family oxidoreductase [Bacillus sp. DX1.1]|uniref:SDR family oxidoreductase n=1 Tax=unclassified Bacillus (in: firmicutes) TaxID=185979 RepID=UPI002570164D|nr:MULTISPECIES: SDR family oxidoreductase [unclassified Bacillus (in: firmicutes)]MDM5154595.1 SDR family oxidoreductase [Bacillus sp. DX1.1]WJE83487.1 SDR family oxidoreductase [Bacillus sp. DX3.1]